MTNLHIVLGVANDKELNEVLPLFPSMALTIFVKPDIPRGLDADELKAQAEVFGLKGWRIQQLKWHIKRR